jgi:phage terminase small subunit
MRHQASQHKQRFVQALITHGSIAKAAEAAGISKRTALRYMKDENVRQMLLELQQETLRAVCQRALDEMMHALSVLVDIANDITAPHSARVSAARTIIDAATKLYDVANLSERVRTLEQKILGVLNNENGQTGATDREA